MRGLGMAIRGALTALTELGIPPWALAIVIGALLWMVAPKIVAAIESDRPRRIMKRAMMETADEQEKVGRQVMGMAEGDAEALVAITEEALRMGKTQIAEQAIEKLRATGERRKDVARFEAILLGPMPGTSMEAAMGVDRLVSTGALAGAKEKLARFQRRWPTDPMLLAAASRLAQREADGAAAAPAPEPDSEEA